MNRQLSLSCSLLSDLKAIQRLLAQLVLSQQLYVFKQSQCQCDHEREYRKLKSFCTGNQKGENLYRVKIWCESDVTSTALLDIQSYHIVVKEEVGRDVYFSGKNVVVVVDVEEVGQILRMSVFQLQKRCKMEYLMRKSHKLYEGEEVKVKLKDMCLRYIKNLTKKGVKSLTQFLQFSSKTKLSLLRRHFTIWRIFTLQGSLSSLDQQIVSSNYFTRVQNKKLLFECFRAWRTNHTHRDKSPY